MWLNFLYFYILTQFVCAKLSGDHVCQEEERYTLNVTKYVLRNITVRTYEWCIQVPPRCSIYKIQQINDTQIEEEENIRYVDVCCPGYRKSDSQDKCEPSECRNCINQTCTNDCNCKPGYKGPNCSQECEDGRWGEACKGYCECDKDICNPETGACDCSTGWSNSRCEILCSEGRSEEQCYGHCNCTTANNFISTDRAEDMETDIDYEEDYEADYLYEQSTERSDSQKVVANYQLIKNGISHRRVPALQKYHTFDTTTARYLSYTTRPYQKYTSATSSTTTVLKKSTSYPYSYFSTGINSGTYTIDVTHKIKSYYNRSLLTTTDTSIKPNILFETTSDKSISTTRILGAIYDHVNNSKDSQSNYSTVHIPEVKTTAVSRYATLRDDVKNIQELTVVNNKADQPVNITKHDQKGKVLEVSVFNLNAGHATEKPFLNDESQLEVIPRDEAVNTSGLFYSVISAILVTISLLLLAGILLTFYVNRKRRRKKLHHKNDTEIPKGMSTVSVTTRSIFHTPLPEPPVFENPVFTTPLETNVITSPATFEAHVVCSMNFPKQVNYLRDAPEFFYDHPPSTGSYRAASIPEPPDSDCGKITTFDPIYDEIPCCSKAVLGISPPPSYASEATTLYMNTNPT